MRAILAVIVLSSLASTLAAQTASSRSVPSEALDRLRADRAAAAAEQGIVPTAVPIASPTQGGTPVTPPSPRLLAIKQANFDRRPSSMLKAWASPELEPLPVEPPPAATTPTANAAASNPSPVVAVPPAADAPSAATPPTQDPVTTEPATDAAVAATEATPPNPTPDQAATAANEAAVKAAADAMAKTAADAAKLAWEQKRIAREIEILRRNVSLGRWQQVGEWINALQENERLDAFEQFVRVLPNVPQDPNQNNSVPANLREQNRFQFDDIIAIWNNAPPKLERKHVELFVPLVQRAFAEGHVKEELLVGLRAQTANATDESRITKRRVAWLLAKLGLETELEGFLTTLDAATAQNDRDGLNLLARFALAMWRKDKKPDQLERAWIVTQAALATGEVSDDAKAEALRRAVEIAPKVRDELGDTWLAESFSSRPERGMEVIATIGGQAARGFQEQMNNPQFRLTGLELQKTAVDALLAAAPERADSWRQSLAILAENWLSEAQHSQQYSTSNTRGPLMRRDSYGNIFWMDGGGYQQSQVQPIEPGKLLDLVPTGPWYELLDPSLKPRFAMVTAQLFLKVNEPENAFPYIEALATSYPANSKELAAEFMRVWIRNHNPNSNNNTNQYMYMYGFDQRSNGIPLTRSQQERNLEDLGKWVARLRALPIDALHERQLVEAFTQAHSTAEVYRLESIEAVFGALDKQKPQTLATLVQGMRANLASVWRKPSTQEDKKTRRKQKDIEREVMRGYGVAREVVEKAISTGGEHWSLVLAYASVLHDQNNFSQELGSSSDFAARRTAAMTLFAHAAELYTQLAPTLSLDEETTEPFETWFYAGLGACDLAAINPETRPDLRQPKAIRRALQALSGEAATRHMSRFANLLFNRMAAVNPAVKSRYLEGGFEIVKDDPQAREARKVYDYYKDLVSELKLVAEVDGSTNVGWEHPFGLRVSLRHTKEIERESGGFGKYLQNQNDQSFSYNYGRPLENYRDKFSEAVSQALAEHFEVLSLTFNSPDVTSKDTDEEGWRVTPYAYLLMKPRGPEVDRIPQIRFDFDFLDTSGYTVLPITSAIVPIDASKTATVARPFEELTVTQILDERKIGSGKLSLEVKATARGLVPELSDVLELDSEEFAIEHTDDQGVSISSFDDDRERIVSERIWNLTLVARTDLGHAATKFRFGKARSEGTTLTRHRYVDADLVKADELVTLGEPIGKDPFPWWWIAIPVLVIAAIGGALWFRRRDQGPSLAVRHQLPSRITPFTVLGLLRDIARDERLGDGGRRELEATIENIESFYFAEPRGAEPDLRHIAEDWVRRAG